jgi:formylglycine-generating enzyme required for sulfatase activity
MADDIIPGPLAVTADAVWVGNSGGGLARFDRAAGTWETVQPALPHMPAVSGIVVTADGTAWVGTAGGGILRFAPDGTPLPGFAESDGHITALAASGNLVWAGTRGGWAYRLAGSAAGVDADAFRVVPAVGPSPALLDDRVEIPAGWFLMGSDRHRPDEAPQRRVYLEAFQIGRYEVTNRQYDEFAAAAGLTGAASWPGLDPMLGRDEYPVAGVRWEEAAAFCEWAGGRLPTEAEWEKAARGTDGRTWPWGNAWDPARANTAESFGEGPRHVGSFPLGVSPYHVADMAGNLEEWVADYYQADYYATAPDRNPTGPTSVVNHVRRGGSWASDADRARTSYRTSSHGSSPDFRAGFRCAWDA